ncbi:glycopeptide antibiotics resistance protein [Bacilli bacterium PM5-3]|nr:glycopeptide antibiotics resistance protein [Bacilli bacterium PM5-3]MDH6603604.1 glycopeptide antibiotics resistance protein [Bacilli bacterium PM5-9]
MNKNNVPYIVIAILTLIYLFFFSSRIVVLTNLNPIIFNLISSVIVFCYLDISYKLFFKKYQLNKLEISFVFISYLTILIYLLFFKNSTTIDSSTMDFIPLFFYHPSAIEFSLLVGNIIMFIPIGYLYKRFNLPFSLIFILLLSGIIEGSQYIFKVGVFDLSDILLYFIGFYLGNIYYSILKKKSKKYNNISYDISLIFTLIVVLCIILLIINKLFF